MRSTDRGTEQEGLALEYLRQQGMILLKRNFHCRLGEIDLIMADDEGVVFVEVRYRKNNLFGGAAASVTPTKQRRLINTARLYLQRQPYGDSLYSRFDVIAISGTHAPFQIEWIKGAFEAF